MSPSEPRNPFYLLLLLVGLLFAVTLLAVLMVPILMEKAERAGGDVPKEGFHQLIKRDGVWWVVYPNPADNSISAETGKTAMNSAASSFKMPQGNALTRFHRVRCSSAHKAPTPVHPPMLHPLGLLFNRTLVGSNRLHVVS